MPLFSVRADRASEVFFAGAARGEFLIIHDEVSGKYHEPSFDTSVDAERYRSVPAAGTGSVVSWSVVHHRDDQGVRTIVVGIVELDEGPWWWTEIIDVDPAADLLGVRVEVDFVKVGDASEDVTQPYYRPSRSTTKE